MTFIKSQILLELWKTSPHSLVSVVFCKNIFQTMNNYIQFCVNLLASETVKEKENKEVGLNVSRILS